MRLAIIVLTGVIAVGVTACSSDVPAGFGVALPGAAQATPAKVRRSPAMVLPSPLAQATSTDVRTAARHFDAVYASSNFTASWHLLASSTQQEIPRAVWVAVHDECARTRTGARVEVKSVTIFGNSAIVIATMTGMGLVAASEEIFDYGDGGWHYLPDDPSIYQHPSVQADVSAAKAAGLCVSGKYF